MIAILATLKYSCDYLRVCLIISFLVCQMMILGESKGIEYEIFNGTRNMNQFRFRDFEPRSMASRSSKNVKFDRLARGFHFHATPNDLIIEMEFIVPFYKIPIDGGMELSKTMLKNLANLNTGSLFNSKNMIGLGALAGTLFKSFITPKFLDFNQESRTAEIKGAHSLKGKLFSFSKIILKEFSSNIFQKI